MKREEQLLREGAKQLGLMLNDRQVSQMILYSEMLADWNTKFQPYRHYSRGGHYWQNTFGSPNLCSNGICGRRPEWPVDVGTGGFPGIPQR